MLEEEEAERDCGGGGEGGREGREMRRLWVKRIEKKDLLEYVETKGDGICMCLSV